MEESFRVRIDKVFGSLSSTTAAAPSPSLNSLWCLTDDEIDRNDRRGEKKEVPEPQPSFPENDQEDSNVDEDEVRPTGLQKPEDYNEEEWEIKSSIGMDTTLDMEEEEDENDKVAVGEELCVVYTKDVNDYEPEADDWVEIPTYFSEREKDPRANYVAAEVRLREDADAVNKLNSLHVSEDNTSEKEKALGVSEEEEEACVGTSDDSGGLKPILKRKESQGDSKLEKRVRFSSDVKDDGSIGVDNEDSAMETSVVQPDHPSGVPDYVQNPSKYTRYTFDEGEEVDEESNRRAYMEFLSMIRSREEPVEDPLVELPTSVAFVPKRKPTGESKVRDTDKGCEGRRGAAIAIVDAVEDCTVSAMDEDEPETAVTVVRRPGRQYRARAKQDEEE